MPQWDAPGEARWEHTCLWHGAMAGVGMQPEQVLERGLGIPFPSSGSALMRHSPGASLRQLAQSTHVTLPRPPLPRGVCKVPFLSGTNNWGVGVEWEEKVETHIPRDSLGPFKEIGFPSGGQLEYLEAWAVGKGEVDMCVCAWGRSIHPHWAGPFCWESTLRGTLSTYRKSTSAKIITELFHHLRTEL